MVKARLGKTPAEQAGIRLDLGMGSRAKSLFRLADSTKTQ